VISAKSSILMRPAGMLPIVMSKKTIGFFGFGGRTCHSTVFPPPDAIDIARAQELLLDSSWVLGFALQSQ
jgi:hypothetical protein